MERSKETLYSASLIKMISDGYLILKFVQFSLFFIIPEICITRCMSNVLRVFGSVSGVAFGFKKFESDQMTFF